MDIGELDCSATLKFSLQAHKPPAWGKMVAIWTQIREAAWCRHTETGGEGEKRGS